MMDKKKDEEGWGNVSNTVVKAIISLCVLELYD